MRGICRKALMRLGPDVWTVRKLRTLMHGMRLPFVFGGLIMDVLLSKCCNDRAKRYGGEHGDAHSRHHRV